METVSDIFAQPFGFVTVTEKLPVEFTVIDWSVEPLDHWLFIALLEVRVTFSPWHKILLSLNIIVGVSGASKTFTAAKLDNEEHPKLSKTSTE